MGRYHCRFYAAGILVYKDTTMLKIDGKHANKKEILKDKQWQPYKQTFIVYAKKMGDEFEVETMNGLSYGKGGDFLVMGPQGNKWVLTEEMFKQLYEKL